jgi:MFS superfamily sulfate permease-like transporter
MPEQQAALGVYEQEGLEDPHETHDGGHGHGHGHGHGGKPNFFKVFAAALVNFLLMFGLCCAYGIIMFSDPWHQKLRVMGVRMNLATAGIMGVVISSVSNVGCGIGGSDLNPVVFLGSMVQTIGAEISRNVDAGLGDVYPKTVRRRLEEEDETYITDATSTVWEWSGFGSVENAWDEVPRRLAGGGGSFICTSIGAGSTASGSTPLGSSSSPMSGSISGSSAGSSSVGNSTGSSRRLAVDWVSEELELLCDEYSARVKVTVIFTVMVSTAVFMILFFFIGTMGLTRYVSYVPTSVMEAFLSCVGYKVFKYAIKFCENVPGSEVSYNVAVFGPAAFVGVVLYFLKANHIGNPALVIPAMLFIPLGFFYFFVFVLYPQPADIPEARTEHVLFFGEMRDEDFWFFNIWTELFGNFSKIDFNAWVATLPELAIMILVVLIDCVLKISSTEAKLPIKALDKNHEIKVYGAGNLAVLCCGGTVGYMQLKFNVINFGITGDHTDRRAGFVYALFCLICYLGPVSQFNYMPRFFLSTMLFFAGAGFVAENLWGSRKYLSVPEWIEIIIILFVFILSGQLLYAVITGLFITGIGFIIKYSHVPAFSITRGGEMLSSRRRHPIVLGCMRHVLKEWVLVMDLKGFIFFGSAQRLIKAVQTALDIADSLPEHRRYRYVILECKNLTGLDASAGKSIQKLVTDGAQRVPPLKVLWSCVSDTTPLTTTQLRQRGLLPEREHTFPNLDSAILFVERKGLHYCELMVRSWRHALLTDEAEEMEIEAERKQRVSEKAIACQKEDDKDIPQVNMGEFFAARVDLEPLLVGFIEQFAVWRELKTGDIIWEPERPGHKNHQPILLMQSGTVSEYRDIPKEDVEECVQSGSVSQYRGDWVPKLVKSKWAPPVATYGTGWFVNRKLVTDEPETTYGIVREHGWGIAISLDNWHKMQARNPQLANGILRMVTRQVSRDNDWVSGVLDTNIHHSRALHGRAGKPAPWELDEYFQNLVVASVFHQWGMYDCDEAAATSPPSSVVPDLPKRVQKTLKRYYEYMASSEDPHTHFTNLMRGLCVSSVQPLRSLARELVDSHADFEIFAREKTFWRLTKQQEQFLKDKFLERTGGQPGLSAQGLLDFFVHEMHQRVSPQYVATVIAAWDEDMSGYIEWEEFLPILTFLIRKHHTDYMELQRLKPVLFGEHGIGSVTHQSTVPVAVLKQLCGEDVEEMCWFMSWRYPVQNFSDEHSFQVKSLVTMLITHVEYGDVEYSVFVAEDVKQIMNTTIEKTNLSVSSDDIVLQQGQTMYLIIDGLPPRLDAQGFKNPRQRQHNRYCYVQGVFIGLSIVALIIQTLFDPTHKGDLIWFIPEMIFTVAFSTEFIIRFLICSAFLDEGDTQVSCRVEFMKDPFNIVDLAAIVPGIFSFISRVIVVDASVFTAFRVLRLLRLARFTRMRKLMDRGSVSARLQELIGAILMVMGVILFIYMKEGLPK